MRIVSDVPTKNRGSQLHHVGIRQKENLELNIIPSTKNGSKASE